METLGAAVWATGRAGQEIVRAGIGRGWLVFRAGVTYTPVKEGLDLALAVLRRPDAALQAQAALRRIKQGEA